MIGYVPLSQTGSERLFEILSQRYVHYAEPGPSPGACSKLGASFFVFGLDLLAERSVTAGHAVTLVLPPHPPCPGLGI